MIVQSSAIWREKAGKDWGERGSTPQIRLDVNSYANPLRQYVEFIAKDGLEPLSGALLNQSKSEDSNDRVLEEILESRRQYPLAGREIGLRALNEYITHSPDRTFLENPAESIAIESTSLEIRSGSAIPDVRGPGVNGHVQSRAQGT